MRKLVFLVAAFAALACLMSGPALFNRVAADDEGAQIKFFYAVRSQAGVTTHHVALSGAGKFGKNDVVGGGGFTHFNQIGTKPFPIISHGTWRATKFLSFTEVLGSPYGEQIAGILEMEVELRPVGKNPSTAIMKVVCNVGAAPLNTGEDEGTTLTSLDGLTFAPETPTFGITLFNPARSED